MSLKAEDVQKLYRESVVINSLDISRWTPAYLRKMRDSGLTAASCTITTEAGLRDTMDLISDWYVLLEECQDCALLVQNAADIRRAKAENKVGIILNFQNATPLEGNDRLVAVYHRLGVRVIQLCYMYGNLLGDGCLESRQAGLTDFGRDVVKALNRAGILIDLSHVGHRTTMDAIAASERPVAITHANSRNLCDHPRNKQDEAFKFCAERGGVVGAVALGAFVSKTEPANMERYLDHIDYLVNLVGVDHVGIGTDFVEGQPESYFQTRTGVVGSWRPFENIVPDWPWPYAVRSVSEFPKIAEGLGRRGYSAANIQAIMGGNWFRLLETVWGG